MSDRHPLADFWKLDPECTYLNHGSFGPSPLPVLEARAKWSERLERQPMKFYCQEMEQELDRTTEVLAEFLNTQPDRLALVDNATVAMNVVAASIKLQAGDEVVLTNHEYGAVKNIWQAKCHETGARFVTAILPFPPEPTGVVEAIEKTITEKTRMIVISHVTSATACILPVQAICRMARRHRIPVCVDGPHAIAMIEIDLNDLGCDYYCASCHKWLCAPFGSGFLWVHPGHHASIRSPIISWGGSISGRPASWKDPVNWMGTRDPAPLLAIREAIEFFNPERLAEFRRHAYSMVSFARGELLKIPAVTPFCTAHETDFVSMAAVEIPQTNEWKPGYHGRPDELQLALRDQFQIETLMGSWNSRRYLRISAHLYTTKEHIEKLVNAIRVLL